MSNFPDTRFIINGQPVDSSSTNKPILDLIERTDYLKDQIDGLSYNAENNRRSNVDCDDSCIDSQLVYLDATTKKWKPSLFVINDSSGTTDYVLNNSSFAQGLIKNISGVAGERKGDIYITGYVVNINPTNLMESAPAEVGVPYYLSGTQEGKITIIRPSKGGVFIGKFASLTTFLLSLNVSHDAESHHHQWMTLDGSKFQDLGSDEWLYPASEIASFPPTPLESSMLYVNGSLYYYGNSFSIDPDGLHYFSSDYPPSSDINIFNAMLFFVQISSSGNGLVYELHPKTSNVEITDCDTGDDSSSGRLGISVINEIESHLNQMGHNVVKRIQSSDDGIIHVFFGNVVESVLGGTGIEAINNNGNIIVSSQNPYADGIIEISDIVLLGAREKIHPQNQVSYICFPSNISTGIICKFRVNNDCNKDIDVFAYIFGLSDTEIANGRFSIENSIHQIGKPVGTSTNVSIREFNINSNIVDTKMFTLKQDNLSSGAIVNFKITRDISDAYSSDIGILFLGRK